MRSDGWLSRWEPVKERRNFAVTWGRITERTGESARTHHGIPRPDFYRCAGNLAAILMEQALQRADKAVVSGDDPRCYRDNKDMTILPETIDKIKTAADIVEVIGRSIQLKKNGKDHFGLCPFHSEKSGSFSVSPDKQMFYCFGCGAGGDVFEFLEKKDGIPFIDAVCRVADQYGIEIQGSGIRGQGPAVRDRVSGVRGQEKKKEEYVPDRAQAPVEIWREKAEKLVSWAHENLLKNEKQLAWLEERGIDLDLVKEFRLGWNPGEDGKDIYRPRESWGLETVLKEDGKTRKKLWIPVGYVIPLIEDGRLKMEDGVKVERIRIRTEREQPKYYVLPGSGMRCLVSGGACRAYVIIESELDAVMVWGKVRANKIGVVALGSASKKPELETYELLKKAPVILNALDFDQAGRKALEWWEERFPETHRRWPVPVGKDPGDAIKAGVDIAAWIRSGLPEAWAWGIRDQGPGIRDQKKPETGFAIETFGRSDLLIDNEKGAAQEVSPLKELAALVKSSPVIISVGQGQLKIKEAPSWALSNSDRSRRISELVFLNEEVRTCLMGLGSAELDRSNIESQIMDTTKPSEAGS